MPWRRAIAAVVLTSLLLAGCGDGSRVAGQPQPTTTAPLPELATAPEKTGEIVVRGDASPGSHGPYELDGTYTVRFVQYAPEDPEMDFAGQTPFTARLDPHVSSDSDTRKAIALFESAAATGSRTVKADGRLWIDVEYGDFPYVIRLTPKR